MKTKILIVDDESNILSLCKEVITEEDKNYEVDTASTKDDGIKKIQENDYDIVISDMMLGKESGIDVLKESFEKQCREKKPSARIAITGLGFDPVLFQEVNNTEAIAYIEKNKKSFNSELIQAISERAYAYITNKEIKILEDSQLELNNEDREFYFSNTRLISTLHDNYISPDDVSMIREGVKDVGLRHVHNNLFIVSAVSKKDNKKFGNWFVKKRSGAKKISKGITGKEKKNLEERTHDEAFLMRYAAKRWAPCTSLVAERGDELIMKYYPEPSDDLEITMFNMQIDNIRNKLKETIPCEDRSELEKKLAVFAKEKEKSIDMSDKSLSDFSAVMTYWMGDSIDYGQEGSTVKKQVFEVMLNKRINQKTNEFDLENHHKKRIKYSLVGRILHNYFVEQSKYSANGEPIDKNMHSSRLLTNIYGNMNFIETFDLDEIENLHFESLTNLITECYKDMSFLGLVQDDMANSEHLGRAVEEDKTKPSTSTEFKIIYDFDRCAIDKSFTDILNYLADHINDSSVDEINDRFERWVVRTHNKMVQLYKSKGEYFNMPQAAVKVEYNQEISSVSELSQDYLSKLMMQKDLIMIEVLMHYSSLGCWNMLRNNIDYKDLIKRKNVRNFNRVNVKNFEINYGDVIDNKVILPIQDKKLNNWFDCLLKNKNKYYKFNDNAIYNLGCLKDYLNSKVKVSDRLVNIIGGGY